MYSVLNKDMIETEIIPLTPLGKRGFPPTVLPVEMVNAILYKLITGVQWHQLRVKALFPKKVISWQAVYHHCGKWCLSMTSKQGWLLFLKIHKHKLGLSSVDLDGNYTQGIRGGQVVEYQGRKKRKTTNALYLTDRQELPLVMSELLAGNHSDLYNIEMQFEEVTATLEQAEITVEGLFLNSDAEFDSRDLLNFCYKKEIHSNICFNKRNRNIDRVEYFDRELYREKYSVERTNAWMDSNRSQLNRFDTIKAS